MQCIYVLQSKPDMKMYIGCTNDLKKRLELHNLGKVSSTQHRRPFKLIYYEVFADKQDAFRREQWLKTGWGRNRLNKILINTLRDPTSKKNLGG